MVLQNSHCFWISIKSFNFIAPSHVQHINYDLIHNSPYQRRKAVDKNTNYSIYIFQSYALYDYFYKICCTAGT